MYNLNYFIEQIQGKDLEAVYLTLQEEISSLDVVSRTIKNNDPMYDNFLEYRKYVGDFLFFLNCGVVPAGIGKDGLKKFSPVIIHLVEIGALTEPVLKLIA